MSLINKALKDLERRQGAEASDQMPAHVRLSPVAPASSVAPMAIGAVVLAAVVLVPAAWFLLRAPEPAKPAGAQLAQAPAKTPEAAPAPQPVVAAPAPAAVPAPAPVAMAPAAPVVAAAPSSAPVPATVTAAAKSSEPVAVKVAEPPVKLAVAPAKPAEPAPKAVEPTKVAAATPKAEAAPPKLPEPTAKPAPTQAKATAVAAVAPPVAASSMKTIAIPGLLKTPVAPAGTPSMKEPPPAAVPTVVATADSRGEARLERTVGPAQLSSNLHAQAIAQLQQGNSIEARPLLRRALEANPANSAARQLLADVLVEGNQIGEAANLLREGVQVTPERSGLWMSLARLELEQGGTTAALATLEKGLANAGQDPRYNAFYATLLQRAGRHDQAVNHYIVALRGDPAMPNWLVGVGISLQALGKHADALEAYMRARDGGRLPGPLAQFVEQRIDQLK